MPAKTRHAQTHLVEHGEDAFTVWYADEEGDILGVLTHDRDADYDRSRQLIACGGVHA
ncbi:MAG TPA: hypothetical protein VIJ39_13960 [Solirubrobacteraceae bacterium]